jgi:hypothetical protein
VLGFAPMAGPPAHLRTDTVSLAALRRLAGQFDEISDETGARYSAGAFVDWLRTELESREAAGDMGNEHRAAGARGYWDAAAAAGR